jgi:hypothetical protein
MKKILIYLLCLAVFSIYAYSSDRVLSTINIDDIDAGGVDSRSNMGSLFDGNRFYVFYPGFHDGYDQRIKVRELKLKSDGTIERHGMVDLNDIQFPGACTLFDSKIFVVAQESGTNEGTLLRMTFDGSNWSGSHKMPSGVKSKCGVALTVLNNKLYCFYKYTDGSIRLITSENGSDWSDYIEVKSAWLDPDHGTIAATTFINNDNVSKIMVCFTNKDNSVIFLQVVNEEGSNEKSYELNTSVNNVSMIQGSTQGGGKGNIIQVIYSKWNHYKVYKREFSLVKGSFSSEEVLEWGEGNESIIGGDDDYVPGILYAFNTEDQNTMQKHIISFNARFYYDSDNNYARDMKIYTWKSDIMKRDRNDSVVTEYEPSPALCKMIGVIEGPPPYASNGTSFGDWGPMNYFPPASLTYGTAKSTSQENTSNISTDFSINVSLGEFGGGFAYETEKSNSTSISKTIINEISLEQTENNTIGYRIFMKPIIHRKKYYLYDWSGESLGYSIYTFKFDGPYVVYEPYKLSETGDNLNNQNIYSYLHRDIPFDSYDRLVRLPFYWRIGTGNTYSAKLSNTIEHSTSTTQKIEVGVDEEFGDIFKVESEFSYNIEYKMSTTSSMETDFSINIKCPGDANNPDHIKGFDGNFYWLLPTDGQDNWWVPSDYAKDKPWLMTYNLDSISKKFMSVISDVETIEVPKDFVNVYPNPAKDILNIVFNDIIISDVSIEITDIMGNRIKFFSYDDLINKDAITWNLKDMNREIVNQGTYVINILTPDKSITKKFSIIK